MGEPLSETYLTPKHVSSYFKLLVKLKQFSSVGFWSDGILIHEYISTEVQRLKV